MVELSYLFGLIVFIILLFKWLVLSQKRPILPTGKQDASSSNISVPVIIKSNAQDLKRQQYVQENVSDDGSSHSDPKNAQQIAYQPKEQIESEEVLPEKVEKQLQEQGNKVSEKEDSSQPIEQSQIFKLQELKEDEQKIGNIEDHAHILQILEDSLVQQSITNVKIEHDSKQVEYIKGQPEQTNRLTFGPSNQDIPIQISIESQEYANQNEVLFGVQQELKSSAKQLITPNSKIRSENEQLMKTIKIEKIVSQYDQQSQAIDQVTSQAHHMYISSNNKMKSKLHVVKNHYKNIIADLQRKLQEVCLRHDESIEQIDLNETITFSEEESFAYGNVNEEIEMKIEEVNTLKEELQMHEEELTSILESQIKLRTKLQQLQEQNNSLKSMIYPLAESNIIEEEEDRVHDYLENMKRSKSEKQSIDMDCLFINKEMTKEHVPMSKINGLYTSQLSSSPNRFASSIFQQSNMLGHSSTAKSTISLMSIVEGALTMGLLGEVRFMNEISKKFAINEIKKALKRRIVFAELLYNSQQEEQHTISLYSIIKSRSNVIFLMKLANGKNLALFVELISMEQQDSMQQQQKCFLMLDLTSRKSYHFKGNCWHDDNMLTFGGFEVSLSEFAPFRIISNKQQGPITLILGETHVVQASFLSIYQLFGQ